MSPSDTRSTQSRDVLLNEAERFFLSYDTDIAESSAPASRLLSSLCHLIFCVKRVRALVCGARARVRAGQL